MSEPVLRVALSAGYGRTTVLTDVQLTLHAGECVGLVGTSGAGKSTLLLALLGLLPWRRGWARGEVRLGREQQDVLALSERGARRVRGREIALIPQSPAGALNPALSLQKQLNQAWLAHKSDTTGLHERVQELLGKVQLPTDAAFLARKPGQISVGQAQRFTVTMALLHRPSVLIADEPTSALDPCAQREVLDLLRSVRQSEGAALLYISHDMLSVFGLCDRVAVLQGGRIAAVQPTATLASGTRDSAFDPLLDALPVPVGVLLAHTCGTEQQLLAGAHVGNTFVVGCAPRGESL